MELTELKAEQRVDFINAFKKWADPLSQFDYIDWTMMQDHYMVILTMIIGADNAMQICEECESAEWFWLNGVMDSYEVNRWGEIVGH